MSKAMPVPVCTTPQTTEHLPKALHILPFSGSCIVPTSWPEPDEKMVAILGVILLWQDISSLICTTTVFQGEYFHDSAYMTQCWFPSHYLSLVWTSEHHSQFATTKAGKNRERQGSLYIQGEKHTLTSVSELLISAKQQAESQHNFVKRSSSPIWVMKRHHLVDVAMCERLHQLAEKIPV